MFKTELLAFGSDSDSSRLEFAAERHGGIMNIHFPKTCSISNSAGNDINDNDNDNDNDNRRISVILNGGLDNSEFIDEKTCFAQRPDH